MIAARIICLVFLFCVFSVRSSAEEFTNAIQAFLQQRVEVEKRDVGIVVGIVDEHGSRVVSCGKMENGTDQEVNGDTLFDIASITKPFTGLLLQDMIERGEMKLDDPAQKYLPAVPDGLSAPPVGPKAPSLETPAAVSGTAEATACRTASCASRPKLTLPCSSRATAARTSPSGKPARRSGH